MKTQKQIILFASIFAIICASKEQQSTEGGFVAAESNHIYSQPIQDNIAAESEVAKRGAATATTSAATSNENQAQSSQIDVGKLHMNLMRSFFVGRCFCSNDIFPFPQVQTVVRHQVVVWLVLIHQTVFSNSFRQHSGWEAFMRPLWSHRRPPPIHRYCTRNRYQFKNGLNM